MAYETIKNIAKYTGKAAATIICPPLGFALLQPSRRSRIFGFLAVLGISFFWNINPDLHSRKIYDNPDVTIQRYPNSLIRGIPEAAAFPLATYFDSHHETSFSLPDKKECSIEGDDVVTFSNGQYKLNFGTDKKFKRTAQLNRASVDEASRKLEEAQKRGDILEARKAKKELESLTQEYAQFKANAEETVRKMNSELEENLKR